MPTPDNAHRTVAVAGATGLVGGEVLRQLLADPSVSRVTALVRRAGALNSHSKLEECVVDFDALHRHEDALRVDQVVCALGTTIKKAGSQERFREVDLGYPFALARVALAQGARHFLLVSAVGADAGSRVFYNRVKGELEESLRALPYRSLTIVRPSLLLGDREEFRPGEEVGRRVARLITPLIPARYKPVHARDVAAALVEAAREDRSGTRVIESREIRS